MATSNSKISNEQAAMQKNAMLQAISQLDMLLSMFVNAPAKVRDSAKAFRDSLEEWANAE